MITRAATYEPMAARPFSYLATGAVVGFSMWYYDYWRRRAIEEVLYADERRRYHRNFYHIIYLINYRATQSH